MITLVTGASSSGKSAFAESVAVLQRTDFMFYIATMHSYDNETVRRIKSHRKMRADKHFETIERYVDIGGINLPEKTTCLLECMSNLLANEMYDSDGSKDKADDKIISDIKLISEKAIHLIIVTNEIFSDGMIYDSFCTDYIDKLGKINSEIARFADKAVEVVAGIPIYHKGEPYAFI
ncbi:MAG: bifunctional adenosylcobinamide kinase/adenosylcobinamide-phosphate guanylyltransferase [Eubacteriales bacterium]